jgi:hypothetical protein
MPRALLTGTFMARRERYYRRGSRGRVWVMDGCGGPSDVGYLYTPECDHKGCRVLKTEMPGI